MIFKVKIYDRTLPVLFCFFGGEGMASILKVHPGVVGTPEYNKSQIPPELSRSRKFPTTKGPMQPLEREVTEPPLPPGKKY